MIRIINKSKNTERSRAERNLVNSRFRLIESITVNQRNSFFFSILCRVRGSAFYIVVAGCAYGIERWYLLSVIWRCFAQIKINIVIIMCVRGFTWSQFIKRISKFELEFKVIIVNVYFCLQKNKRPIAGRDGVEWIMKKKKKTLFLRCLMCEAMECYRCFKFEIYFHDLCTTINCWLIICCCYSFKYDENYVNKQYSVPSSVDCTGSINYWECPIIWDRKCPHGASQPYSPWIQNRSVVFPGAHFISCPRIFIGYKQYRRDLFPCNWINQLVFFFIFCASTIYSHCIDTMIWYAIRAATICWLANESQTDPIPLIDCIHFHCDKCVFISADCWCSLCPA